MSQTKAQLFDVSVEGPTALKNGAFDVTLGAGGNVTISDGNLVLASGKGIDFSADGNGRAGSAATNELLADYEEGTWTAIVRNYSSLPTFTASPANTTGYYVKVGNLCTVYYYTSSFTVSANGTGAAIISGLPFLSANVSQGYIAATFTHANCFTTQIQNGYINPGDSFVVPVVQGGTSGTSWVTGSAVYLMFSLTYRTE